jgi:hypothetical protein
MCGQFSSATKSRAVPLLPPKSMAQANNVNNYPRASLWVLSFSNFVIGTAR